MIHTLGRFTLLVRDHEEALDFYCGVLGFAKIHDSTGQDGQRYVHVGVRGQELVHPVGLWLLRAAKGEEGLVGRQAGAHPLLVLYTDDCRGTMSHLERRGVRFTQPATERDGAVVAHFRDIYGNALVLVELTEALRQREALAPPA